MRLPIPKDDYTREVNRILEAEDRKNYKRDQNIELGANDIILMSPNGTRYKITVSNAGVLSAVLV